MHSPREHGDHRTRDEHRGEHSACAGGSRLVGDLRRAAHGESDRAGREHGRGDEARSGPTVARERDQRHRATTAVRTAERE